MFKTTGQDAKCEEFSSNNDVQDSNFPVSVFEDQKIQFYVLLIFVAC